MKEAESSLKWVENTVGKGEIACHKRLVQQTRKNQGLFGKGLTTQSQILMTLKRKPFENIEGKGENAGNQHFLLFPQCFLPIPRRISSYIYFLICKCFQFGPV